MTPPPDSACLPNHRAACGAAMSDAAPPARLRRGIRLRSSCDECSWDPEPESRPKCGPTLKFAGSGFVDVDPLTRGAGGAFCCARAPCDCAAASAVNRLRKGFATRSPGSDEPPHHLLESPFNRLIDASRGDAKAREHHAAFTCGGAKRCGRSPVSGLENAAASCERERQAVALPSVPNKCMGSIAVATGLRPRAQREGCNQP